MVSRTVLILRRIGTLVLAFDARTRAFKGVDELTGFENADKTSLPLWASPNQTDEQDPSGSKSEGKTQTDGRARRTE